MPSATNIFFVVSLPSAPIDELPEPGALFPVKESEIDQGAQGSPYSQEPSCGEVGSWNPEDPTFKFDKVDGRKEDKSPG